MSLTAKRIQTYVAKSGVNCVGCDGANLSGGFIEVCDGGAVQEMTCDDCGATWNDAYKLSDVSNFVSE